MNKLALEIKFRDVFLWTKTNLFMIFFLLINFFCKIRKRASDMEKEKLIEEAVPCSMQVIRACILHICHGCMCAHEQIRWHVRVCMDRCLGPPALLLFKLVRDPSQRVPGSRPSRRPCLTLSCSSAPRPSTSARRLRAIPLYFVLAPAFEASVMEQHVQSCRCTYTPPSLTQAPSSHACSWWRR